MIPCVRGEGASFGGIEGRGGTEKSTCAYAGLWKEDMAPEERRGRSLRKREMVREGLGGGEWRRWRGSR